MKNVGAYTPGGQTPPYISINLLDNGNVGVTVRSALEAGELIADRAFIELSLEDARVLFKNTVQNLTELDVS